MQLCLLHASQVCLLIGKNVSTWKTSLSSSWREAMTQSLIAKLTGWDQLAWPWESKELNSRSLTPDRLFCRSMSVLDIQTEWTSLVFPSAFKWKWCEAASLSSYSATQRCFVTAHAAWTSPPHLCQEALQVGYKQMQAEAGWGNVQ